MLEGKKISAILPKLRKKSFNIGSTIPTKKRLCNECNDKEMCNNCNNQVIENKEFEANLNLLKRQTPNEFGYIVPYFRIKTSKY